MSDLTTKILVEIRDEVKALRGEHGARLDMLEQHSRDHSQLLKDHSQLLKEQGQTLKEQGQTLKDHGSHLRINVQILKQILGAVEYGNMQRDIRLARVEDHLDLPLDE